MKNTKIKITRDKEGLRINGQLCEIKEYKSGIVSIENRTAGCGHSCYPNIDESGSVKGMKSLGYWGKHDKMVKAGGFIYNVSRIVISDPLDLLAYHLERGIRIPIPREGETKEIELKGMNLL